jgi:LuxR family maltose regulon positive regulatory protein
LLSAQIAAAGGDDPKAVDEVLRAVELAGEAIVEPFAASREHLTALLSRHGELRATWPSESHQPVNEPLEPTRPMGRRLAEPLTDREISVLRRLATTMTSAEIADELSVSINTVKTHIAAIYRKLPAAGRRDAVWRARELELL